MKRKDIDFDDLLWMGIIGETHHDFSPWNCLITGFDKNKNFLIVWEYINDDYPEYSSYTVVSIDPENAVKLARKLDAPLKGISWKLSRRFHDDPMNFTTARARDTLTGIESFLDSCGVRYRKSVIMKESLMEDESSSDSDSFPMQIKE